MGMSKLKTFVFIKHHTEVQTKLKIPIFYPDGAEFKQGEWDPMYDLYVPRQLEYCLYQIHYILENILITNLKNIDFEFTSQDNKINNFGN